MKAMKVRTARTLIAATAAVALLGMAPAAHADRYSDRYQRSQRYPSRHEMQNVQVVAHQLEDATYRLSRDAERVNRRPSPPVARMLDSLRDLNSRAVRFHRQVESYYQDPRRTEAEFAALLRSYDYTLTALDSIHPQRYLLQGMDRIDDLMGRISYSYDRYSEYDSRPAYGHGSRWRAEHYGDRYHGRYGDRGSRRQY